MRILAPVCLPIFSRREKNMVRKLPLTFQTRVAAPARTSLVSISPNNATPRRSIPHLRSSPFTPHRSLHADSTLLCVPNTMPTTTTTLQHNKSLASDDLAEAAVITASRPEAFPMLVHHQESVDCIEIQTVEVVTRV